ncbi:acyl-CoA N-acyltransferase [Backusella circina FSU 941]|nr:acyl-CoA N-acyltransferase [Backusella circina FSU 941]
MSKPSPLELYTIREATEADAPQILEIYNERILNSTCLFMYDAVPLENRINWLRDSKAKGYPVIVAAEKETNKAIAYASYGGFRPHTAYVLSSEISVYINLAHHRRGLGAVMLEEMMRIAKEMKLRSIIASITSENTASILLFEKYGFKYSGKFSDVGYKFGRYLDVTFLEYITGEEAVVTDGIPAFEPFPWGNYVFGGAK